VWSGYQWPSGFGLSGGVRYFGTVFADNDNLFEVEGYGTLALAARYEPANVLATIRVRLGN